METLTNTSAALENLKDTFAALEDKVKRSNDGSAFWVMSDAANKFPMSCRIWRFGTWMPVEIPFWLWLQTDFANEGSRSQKPQ